jgi:hypothetical protein
MGKSKCKLFDFAIKKLLKYNGLVKEDYEKLLKSLSIQQRKQIENYICSGEDMKGVLGFFLYEIDAIELRAWVLTEK